MATPTPAGPGSERTRTKDARTKGILALSLPLIFSFWFRALTPWIDATYASTDDVLGDASIAAIGLAAPFEFLMIAFWVGSSNALTSLLSTAMGRDEDERVAQLVRWTRRLVYALGGLFALIAALVWFFAEDVIRDPEVARQFKIYGTTLIGGYSFTIFWSVIPDSVVKAHHDMKTTMWSGIASTVLNVVLSSFFVFGVGLGVFGIALGSVLGRLGGLAYGLYRAAKLERERRATLTHAVPGTFERPTFEMLRLAVPASIAFLLMALEGFAFNGILERQPNSESLLASWTLLDRTARFLLMPVIAIGVAMLPLLARLKGHDAQARIRRELRHGHLFAFGFALLVATPLALFVGPWACRELLDSPAAAELATSGMRYVPLVLLTAIPIFILRPGFEGLQKPAPGLRLSVLRSVVLAVPLGLAGFLLGPRVGLTSIQGLLVGAAVANALAGVMGHLWMQATLDSLDAQPAPASEGRPS